MLMLGDCIDKLKTLRDCSVDAVVTDPPYGLAFMGKKWDYDVPAVEVWAECLRVLKPGGHLLAFAGTRTQHRMAVRIEDAGFEIRDMIAWVYGSGFPKSLDVSKAIDKSHGENRDRQLQFTAWMRSTGITAEQINEATGSCMASHYLTDKSQPAIATADMFDKLRPHLPEVPEYVERLVCERTGLEWTAYKQRPVVGRGSGAISTRKELRNDRGTVWGADSSEFDITAPATDAARQWHGWGTALKPALEPITVARKPLAGTVAENVLQHGTGGINVDACRVAGALEGDPMRFAKTNGGEFVAKFDAAPVVRTEGRWPANLIHSGEPEVVGLFPQTSPSPKGIITQGGRAGGGFDVGSGDGTRNGKFQGHGDSGSAARFFYCAKASKADRDEGCEGLEAKRRGQEYGLNAGGTSPQQTPHKHEPQRNHHPTVKPTALMRYLCRLVTPPGGIVLDPFMGSGSTGKGAILEGFRFIGIERDPDYMQIAESRINHAQRTAMETNDVPHQLELEVASA